MAAGMTHDEQPQHFQLKSLPTHEGKMLLWPGDIHSQGFTNLCQLLPLPKLSTADGQCFRIEHHGRGQQY